jgi:hypothetical protein
VPVEDIEIRLRDGEDLGGCTEENDHTPTNAGVSGVGYRLSIE